MAAQQMTAAVESTDGGASRRMSRLSLLAYGAMVLGAGLYVLSLWGQVYIDTRYARGVSIDAFSESHRHWRIRTTLVFLIWSVLGGFTLPFGIGWFFLLPAYLWYCYRTVKGLAWFLRGRPVGRLVPAVRRTTSAAVLAPGAGPAD